MIVIECSTDDYGTVMSHLSCIKEKTEELEEILTDSTMNQRRRYDEDDKKSSRYGSSRYIR